MTITELPASAKTQSPKSFLLTSIAKTHLGNIAAIIVSTLISHGRLTAQEISTKCKLPIKTVKSALVSLVQLNCVYYWSDQPSAIGGASKSRKVYHYSFNETGLFVFVHSGDIINYINQQYDSESAEIIQNVIQVGHVRVQDYLSQYDADSKAFWEQQNRFFKLFSDGWLKRLQYFDYSPINDLWNKLYQESLKQIPRNATTSEIKRVNEAKEKTRIKVTNLLESGLEAKDLYEVDGGIKKLKPSLVVTFNLTRFEKHLRSRALANFSKSRVGTLSSAVYLAALKTIEQKSPELRSIFLDISGLINDPDEERTLINSIENKLIDQKQTTFSARDLVKYLDKRVDLRNSILNHNFLKPKRVAAPTSAAPKKKIKLEDGGALVIPDDDDEDDDDGAQLHQDRTVNLFGASNSDFTDNSDAQSISLITHHLKLLASSTSVNFLIEVSPGTFTVPFTALIEELKQYAFDDIVKSTLGLESFKILRCLRSLRLADEKTIANTILLKEKTVRNELCKLININAVEIQEVPRSADRAASKTFFLFRHKSYISYQFLSNSLLFNMAENLNNIELFKLDHKILLEKCEREDVKGHEDQLLLESELKTLRDLQSREIRNIGKFNRLKCLYDIFGLL